LVKLRELEKFAIQNGKQPKMVTIKQFGIIKFVPEGETSTLCPSCGKKAYKNSEDKKYTSDKKQKIFHCSKEANGGIGDCGFHNHKNPGDYFSLDTNDKIAAFNIAKRGFETLKNLTNDKH
jgi:hypothetical protein